MQAAPSTAGYGVSSKERMWREFTHHILWMCLGYRGFFPRWASVKDAAHFQRQIDEEISDESAFSPNASNGEADWGEEPKGGAASALADATMEISTDVKMEKAVALADASQAEVGT